MPAAAAAAADWEGPVEVRFFDMVEEVGELAQAVLVDVFALADHYHVELDELYPRMLARLVAGHPGGAAGGAGNDPEAGWREGSR